MLLDVKHLTITAEMSKGTKTIVSDLSFSLAKGERLAVVGESGCGKTMTAMSVMGLLPANCKATGEIVFDGTDLLSRRGARKLHTLRGEKIMLVPQSGGEFLNPSIRISTQIYESLRKRGVHGRNALRAAARGLLREVGLSDAEEILDKYPFQLSGGQAQRVVLAIAASGDAELVIADEPTKGIDEETAQLFLGKIDELFPSAAVIIITHNVRVASDCDKTLVMYKGEIMEYGDTRSVLGNPSHPYTQSLIAALPDRGFGVYPRLRDPSPAGCVFSDRCPYADDECFAAKPVSVNRDGTVRRCFRAECR